MASSSSSSSSTAKKRKRAHKTLSIEEKVEILDQIPNKSYRIISEKYGVGTSTISDIKKHGSELRDYKRKMIEMGCTLPSKIGKDQKLEEAVFLESKAFPYQVKLTRIVASIYKVTVLLF